MKHRFLAIQTIGLAAWCILALLLAIEAGAATALGQEEFITVDNNKVHPTRILAKFKDGVTPELSKGQAKQLASKLHKRYKLVPYLVALEEESDALPPLPAKAKETERADRLLKRIEKLKASGLFEYVEPDYVQETCLKAPDPAFADGTLWGLWNYGQNGGAVGADISATNAWDITTGSTNVIVAVIDTGIRFTHRELAGQMWTNPGEIPGNGIDDDNNGFVDDVFGINAITGSGFPFDDHSHGTHCAGTIGAASDTNTIVGVTWKVRLMACKFISATGGGYTADAITCIDYAVGKGARILNNSWGGGAYSSALYDAIARAGEKGVLFVAAAGNSARDNDSRPFYPACYPLDNIISVAAINRYDNLASFSNYGATTVHVGAPGVQIYSSTAGSDAEYQFFSGTSMAAPHVCGVAALILAKYPGADLDEIRGRILLGAATTPALRGRTTTGGRVNAFNALKITGGPVLQATVTPPSGSAILSGSTQPFFVKVRNPFGVTDATVTATVSRGTAPTFNNTGQSPDAIAGDSVYSGNYQVPTDTNPVTMRVVVTAPGKFPITNLLTYFVVPPPVNDHFQNAIKVPEGGTTYLSNNRFGTREVGEPHHAGLTTDAASLWWSLSPTISTNYLVDTTGSMIDTVVAVYTGNTLTSLQPLAAANDIGQKKQAYLTFNAQAGTAYRIAVAGVDTNATGSIQLRIAPGGQLDITPPVLYVSSPPSGLTVTNDVLTIQGTAADPTPDPSGVREVLVSVNDSLSSSAMGTSDWTFTTLLRPGINTIKVRAVDAARNYSPTVTLQVNYFIQDPVNDIFANAIVLSGTAGSSSVGTTNATKEAGEPNHAGNTGGKSVWWFFTPPTDGVLSLNTSNSTFDTVLAVYIGNTVSTLTPVAANDDANLGTRASALTQAVRSNVTYRIAVDGFDGASGTAVLRYAFVPAPIFRVNVSSAGGGAVSPGSNDYASNAIVSLTATPLPYHEFDQWRGSILSLANPLTFTVTDDMDLTAVFRMKSFTDGFESGNLQRLGWVTSGNVPWLVQTNRVAAGQFAARSGQIADAQTSVLRLTANFRAGTGSFDYLVSSEPFWDWLDFYLDNVLLKSWCGEVGWATFQFPISAGTHTLEWRYTKDESDSAGLDAAFIDNVLLPIVVGTNASTAARLKLVSTSDGVFYVEGQGQVNQLYITQVSTDLKSWQNIATNTAFDGTFRVVDAASVTNQTRYYRAYVPVP